MGLFPPVMQNLSMNRSGEEVENTQVISELTVRALDWSPVSNGCHLGSEWWWGSRVIL